MTTSKKTTPAVQPTDEQIKTLRTEAGAAGDAKMVRTCTAALNDSKRALRTVARVLAAARAPTYYAAIDAGNLSGAVYGIGHTEAGALADARRGEPSGAYRVVPCTEAAANHVASRGGGPSPLLVVSRTGICLRSEEP